MRWREDEFEQDAIEDDASSGSSDNDDGPPPRPTIVADPEEWMDRLSDELLDLWYVVENHCKSLGLPVLDACTFADFAQFCFEHSSGRPPVV